MAPTFDGSYYMEARESLPLCLCPQVSIFFNGEQAVNSSYYFFSIRMAGGLRGLQNSRHRAVILRNMI